MRATVADVYQAYLKELGKYYAWTNNMKRKYGKDSHPMESWGNHDYERVVAWNGELKAMVRILGLTKAEQKAADALFKIAEG